MLRDPKARALAENFAGQWLQLRNLDEAKPDPDRFPNFDDELRRDMKRETELFFEAVVKEDRSILDFLDAKFTYLNDRLADHYGIPGVEGSEFRRVTLTGDQRSGILTQASILTVSSYPNRTSPVIRGKWILENILNTPPPPPPPGVPNLDEAAVGNAGSLRQQLEKHRSNAICASCHSRMDPLGFGLENYDAIGAWRTQDGKFPIDATGTLPNGKSFTKPSELKAILRADKDEFSKGLTEKMMTYALGRGLERFDRPAVQSVNRRLAAEGYRFSALVMGIVESMPFPDAPRRRTEIMITRKHLPRRTFLRGLGAAVALPVLDAMTPAFAARHRRQSSHAHGVRLRSERHHHEGLDAGGRRCRFRVASHAGATEGVQGSDAADVRTCS